MAPSEIAAGSVYPSRGELRLEPAARGRRSLTFVTEAEELSTMQTLPGRPVWITNARALTPALDREGFVLVRTPSAVADFDLIQEDPDGRPAVHRRDDRPAPEVTGAAKAFMLGGGKKRYGESATDKLAPLQNAKPARYPARRQHRRFGRRSSPTSSSVRRRLRASAVPDAGRCTTCGARSRRRRRTSRSRCATRARSHPTDEVTVTAITDGAQRRHRPRHHGLPATTPRTAGTTSAT